MLDDIDVVELCDLIIKMCENPDSISDEVKFQLKNKLFESTYGWLDDDKKIIHGVNTKERIIEEHSKLYVPFIVTPTIEWQ